MTRTHVHYDNRDVTRRFAGVDVTEPVAGFFRYRLRSGAVRGGVRIWFGPPRDPVTGEELDRSHRWQAEFDGEYVELDDVWPACAGEPITEERYREFCGRKKWAETNAPDSAFAKRKARYDPLSTSTPLPF